MISRGLNIGRQVLLQATRSKLTPKATQAIRNSHVVSYRSPPPPHSRATLIGAEAIGAAMWWWVLWHLWHEPDHILGEFPYPDTSSWSNSELGVPK